MFVYRLQPMATFIRIEQYSDPEEYVIRYLGQRTFCVLKPGRDYHAVPYVSIVLQPNCVFGCRRISDLHVWFDQLWEQVINCGVPFQIVCYAVDTLVKEYDTQVVFDLNACCVVNAWDARSIKLFDGKPGFEFSIPDREERDMTHVNAYCEDPNTHLDLCTLFGINPTEYKDFKAAQKLSLSLEMEELL